MQIKHTHSGRFREKVAICAVNTGNFFNRHAKTRAAIILISLASPICCQGRAAIIGSDSGEDFENIQAARAAAKAGEGESALYATGDTASDETVMAEGFYYELHDDEVDGEFWFESSDYIGDGIYLATFRGSVENTAAYELYGVGLAVQFFLTPEKGKVFSYDNSDHTWRYDYCWAWSYGVEGQNVLLSMDRNITDVSLSCEYEGIQMSVSETDEVTLIPFGDLMPGERAYRNIYFHKVYSPFNYTWAGQLVSKNPHGPVSLTALEITGPNSVAGNLWAKYKATAYLENNIREDVTDLARWRVQPDALASAHAGLLLTRAINQPQEITVYVACREGGAWHQAEKTVRLYPDERVPLHVPSDFPTIQTAIDSAKDGDLIVIEPGRYTGEGNRDIDFSGKAITIRSTNPYDSDIVAATIIDCNGTEGEAHRGFYFYNNEDADSVLAGVTITNGHVRAASGGGILCRKNSSPTIINCSLIANYAFSSGGGIFNYSDSSPTVVNCTFRANVARGWRGYGGGGMCNVSGSSPKLYNCRFIANQCGQGGGMANRESSPMLVDCVFIENSGYEGAGLRNSGGSVTMRDCIFVGNSAESHGGAVENDSGSVNVSNCVFSRNIGAEYGGAISSHGGTINLGSSTFSENSAPRGRAVAFEATYSGYGSEVRVGNSILWDGGDEVWVEYGSTVTIEYSDVQGGFEGEGNINADPCFAFASDYHLMAGSACIDAGSNTPNLGLAVIDRDGNRRPLDGDGDGNNVADMGAYEYNPGKPSIAVSERSFSFVKGHRVSPQRLRIRNCGAGTLNWEIIEDCDWLEAWPTSGLSTGDVNEVSLIADFNGFAPGDREDHTLTVVDEDAFNSPVTIDVSLYVPQTLRVPADYPTIQEAIDAARDFDKVVLSPGRYTGDGNRDLDFKGKPITVCSINPQDPNIVALTIIDCNGAYEDYHRGFYFHYSEDANSIVDGLTIINGYLPMGPVDGSESWGGGIFCEPAGPTIGNCIIRNNSSGIYGCEGPVANCVISGNSGTGLVNCKGSVTNCVISYNLCQGLAQCSGVISNSTVINNYGWGLVNSDGSATVANCIFWRNKGVFGSDSHMKYVPQIQLGDPYGGIYLPSPASADLSIRYSDIEGGREGIHVGPGCTLDYGSGNTDQDPLVTPGGHLRIGSPCINEGDPNSDAGTRTDIDGETRITDGRVDMGADEYIDGDKDGLPNWWEKKYFGDPFRGEPDEDCDSDQYVNSSEYALSTDPTVAGRRFYVDASRPDDSGDGLSWETAKKTILQAIWAAWCTDSIIVAEGRYAGYGNRDLPLSTRAVRLTSKDPADANVVAATIIDCGGTQQEQHRAFLFENNGTYSVMQGFTITGGYAQRGGAIRCYQSSPTIRSCSIVGNVAEYAGGAIDCNESGPTIIDCKIGGNRSLDVGGAISCLKSSATIRRCSIVDNEAEYGGAIECNQSSPTIVDCDINGNRAGQDGGGICCQGGSPIISNCQVRANSAGQAGGGIYYSLSSPIITNCAITGNNAGFAGGGIGESAFRDCYPQITNCIISGNTSPNGGGLAGCSGSLTNCTIVGNYSYVLFRSRPEIRNCIIWDNEPPLERCIACYSCLDSGADGAGCISSDPCFAVPGHWQADTWVGGDYHLKSRAGRWDSSQNKWVTDVSMSPCIDAGDSASGWDGELWPHGKRINMGAYGGTPQASMSLSRVGNKADLNNDGIVGFADVEVLVEKWLFEEALLAEDIDRNASVDFKDFAVLADNWLWQE